LRGGSERLIDPDAAIGLHQYAFPGVQSVDFNTEYYEDKRYFISRGVAADFLEKAYATPNESMWEPSHKELFEANLITSYPKRGEVAMSGVRPEDLDELEAELLGTSSLFLALKNHEPEIYKSMLAEIKDGFLRGKSIQDMQVKTLPLIELAYARRLPYASDDAEIAFVNILIEEMVFLSNRDPILCYWYVRDNTSEPPASWTQLPEEIRNREFETGAMIINSAASGLYYPPTEEQIQTSQEQIMTRLTQEFGVDVSLLAGTADTKADKARYCEISIALFSEILKLPKKDAGSYLRYLNLDDDAISGIKSEEFDDLEASLLTNALYVALKNHEPDIYERIMAELKDSVLGGISMQELEVKTLSLVQSVYERRVPYASDEAVIAFVNVFLDQMEFLYGLDASLCYWYLYESDSVPPNSPFTFPDEIREREIEAGAMVINSAASGLYYPPTEEEIESIQHQILTGLIQQFPENISLLGGTDISEADKGPACEVAYAMYFDIRELPKKDAASYLRYLMSG